MKNKTSFGILFNLLRVQNNENISDAAIFLNVSKSYITLVEKGEREIPEDWVNKIISHYNLNNEQQKELVHAYINSSKSPKIGVSVIKYALMNAINNATNDEQERERGRKEIDDFIANLFINKK